MPENLNGDKDFQDYLDKNPPGDQLGIIIKTINQKAKNIYDFYSKTLDIYKDLKENDPLKDELQNFIQNLINISLHTLSQFDYALLEDDSENGEEIDGE